MCSHAISCRCSESFTELLELFDILKNNNSCPGQADLFGGNAGPDGGAAENCSSVRMNKVILTS